MLNFGKSLAKILKVILTIKHIKLVDATIVLRADFSFVCFYCQLLNKLMITKKRKQEPKIWM